MTADRDAPSAVRMPDFLGAMRGAVEQKIRHVGAGDEQHEEDRAEHGDRAAAAAPCRCSCR